MALLIDALPDEVVKLQPALEVALEKHRILRAHFGAAALAGDEMGLRAIRARLADADSAIEAAYTQFHAALQRFGADVCAAVRSLMEEPEPALIKED